MSVHRNFDWTAFRELTVGTGGVGKTTAFLERLKGQKAVWIFVYDHKHEMGRKLGKAYCYTVDDLVRATDAGGWVCFDPCEMFPGDKVAGFAFFCDFVYNVVGEFRGRKLLVADELQDLHFKSKRPHELMLCVSDGRNFELDCLFIAQATNSIHNEVRGQMTEVYTFIQNEDSAIEDLREKGFNEADVRALRPGEWLHRGICAPETTKGGKAFKIKSPRVSNFGVHR